jgi:hypothetical protein
MWDPLLYSAKQAHRKGVRQRQRFAVENAFNNQNAVAGVVGSEGPHVEIFLFLFLYTLFIYLRFALHHLLVP